MRFRFGIKSTTEYVLRVRVIADTLISIGDSISEQDQIDSILEGLPEEFNPFVMMIYGRSDSPSLYDIEGLLLVQESQLAKFRQELSTPSASANLAHSRGGRGNPSVRGRGRSSRGRSSSSSTGNRPTCQLCGQYGHPVFECWYKFDENFVQARNHGVHKPDANGPKDTHEPPQACTANFASSSQELVIPQS
jgi:histone deacetylase 1/2